MKRIYADWLVIKGTSSLFSTLDHEVNLPQLSINCFIVVAIHDTLMQI